MSTSSDEPRHPWWAAAVAVAFLCAVAGTAAVVQVLADASSSWLGTMAGVLGLQLIWAGFAAVLLAPHIAPVAGRGGP